MDCKVWRLLFLDSWTFSIIFKDDNTESLIVLPLIYFKDRIQEPYYSH